MTLTTKPRKPKKLDPKYSKFKSKNQQIRVVKISKLSNKKDGLIKVVQTPKGGLIEDIGDRQKVVISKKQDDNKPRGFGEKDSEETPQWLARKRRALKREAREKKRAQAEDRENRAERRALRLAREWEQKMELQKDIVDYYEKQKEVSDRTSLEENINKVIERSGEVRVLIENLKLSQNEPSEETSTHEEEEDLDDLYNGNSPTERREKELSPVLEEESFETEDKEAEDRTKMPPPKTKSATEKTEKELRMEAREKKREEEERKAEEEYWPVWDEMPKEKKKRKKTCDRIAFKKSDYNMTDSDESSDEDEESRYAPSRTSAPSPKQAPSDKPAKFIPLWAQGELLEQALEKQSDPFSFDLDALFFLTPTPDMKLMFPKKKKKWRRTSSAIWLAPPPASFRVHSAA